MEENILWMWMSYLKSQEVSGLNKLLEYYETPYNIFITNTDEYKTLITSRDYDIINMNKDYDRFERDYNSLLEKDIKYVALCDEDYPEKLLNIPDKPYGLFYKGRLPNKNSISISIVGARKASIYGKEIAKKFAYELARRNVQIISGLALGIDGCAHRGALEANGFTIGVLGGGIDTLYPRENYNLYSEMIKRGGIISEYYMGTTPKPRWFPIRNRIISGLSDGILVVEAKRKSGSLITVDQGLEQGKYIYAVPGRVTDECSTGCNDIIRQGAILIETPEQLLEEFNMDFSDGQINLFDRDFAQKEKLLANEEKILYSCLCLEPKYIDDIVLESRMSLQDAINILFGLEMKGYIKQTMKNYYIISV